MYFCDCLARRVNLEECTALDIVSVMDTFFLQHAPLNVQFKERTYLFKGGRVSKCYILIH